MMSIMGVLLGILARTTLPRLGLRVESRVEG